MKFSSRQGDLPALPRGAGRPTTVRCDGSIRRPRTCLDRAASDVVTPKERLVRMSTHHCAAPRRSESTRATMRGCAICCGRGTGSGVVGPLSGGHRNEVLEVRRGRRRMVARRSRRRPGGPEWELDLLEYLGAHGFTVPGVVPAADDRRHIDGVVVQTWVEGEAPH
ncbi:phosphotransferase [Streptomyces sp. NPDC002574]|uniref:phosphotransferase n=1 Tax=Streptomyces sp. NPDC002574 TaxID=3364652 RepID=UPI0036831B2E